MTEEARQSETAAAGAELGVVDFALFIDEPAPADPAAARRGLVGIAPEVDSKLQLLRDASRLHRRNKP